MDTQLKFRCPNCSVGLVAEAAHAGLSDDCPGCNAMLTVPPRRSLLAVARPANLPKVIPADDDGELDLSDGTVYRRGDDKPVEVRLGNIAGFKADVDRPTRNAMATMFLGAILVALGAILFSMFGGKSKS